MTEQINKLNIAGITKIVKPKKIASGIQKERFETKSFKIDHYIYVNYPDGKEFVTSQMGEELKSKYDFTSSDMSGQLYAKKNSGLLENRKPTTVEADVIGKGVSIWHATEKLYEIMKVDMEAYSSRTLNEVNSDPFKNEE